MKANNSCAGDLVFIAGDEEPLLLGILDLLKTKTCIDMRRDSREKSNCERFASIVSG